MGPTSRLFRVSKEPHFKNSCTPNCKMCKYLTCTDSPNFNSNFLLLGSLKELKNSIFKKLKENSVAKQLCSGGATNFNNNAASELISQSKPLIFVTGTV